VLQLIVRIFDKLGKILRKSVTSVSASEVSDRFWSVGFCESAGQLTRFWFGGFWSAVGMRVKKVRWSDPLSQVR
jgi:hypothetical protein